MSKAGDLIKSTMDRAFLRRWTSRANKASAMPIEKLAPLTAEAHATKLQLERFLRESDDRLGGPAIGNDHIEKPRGCDWAWRAEGWAWRSERLGHAAIENGGWLAKDLQLFHDCKSSEISVRQIRNLKNDDTAAFSFRLEVFGFDGSFLSLVQTLPDNATKGLKRNHIIRMRTKIWVENPVKIYSRLNIQVGPNTETIVREIPWWDSDPIVEFDLAEINVNESRIENAWIDLIFDDPAMMMVDIQDLTFTRSPRAEL